MSTVLGSAILFLKGDTAGLAKALNVGKKDLKTFEADAKRFSLAVGAAFTAAGAAITAGLGLSAKEAADFGAGMANVATLGVENLGGLADGVRDLSIQFAQTKIPTKELYDTISAQIPEDAAINVLGAAAKGARAGVGELKDALDAGTSLLDAYGLKTNDAALASQRFEEIQGKLATTIKFGKTTIADLGGAVGMGASLFANAGVSMNEYLASVAAITQTGQSASESTTKLVATVSSILKPTAEATKLADSMGIQFDALALKEKGLSQFLRDTVEAIKANVGAGEDWTSVAAKMFGSSEALNAVMALTSDKVQLVDAAVADMSNAVENLNAAYEASKAADPTFTYAQMGAALRDLKISFGQVVLEGLGPFVQMLASGAKALAGFAREHPIVTKAIVALVAALGAFVSIMGVILLMLPAFSAAMALAGAAGTTMWAGILGPIALVVAGFIAVIAVIAGIAYAIYRYWDEIKGVLAIAWDWIKAGFRGTVAFIADMWGGLKDLFKAGVDFLKDLFGAVVEIIAAPFKAAFNIVAYVVNKIIDAINAIPDLKIPDWVPGIGGGVFGIPEIPNIPSFAAGGVMPKTGWALVGESGPELAFLGGGSRVVSNRDSQLAMAGGVSISVGQLVVREEADVRRVAEELYGLQRRAARARGL